MQPNKLPSPPSRPGSTAAGRSTAPIIDTAATQRSSAAVSSSSSNKIPLKKVSSTGNMKDARTSAIVNERRRHKRRNYNDSRRKSSGRDTTTNEWVDSLHGCAVASSRYNYTMSNGHRPNSNNNNSAAVMPKPQLKRVQTAPPSSSMRPLLGSSTLVDSSITSRARSIREDLRQYEMQELALEAERAAESGCERFVGGVSRFNTRNNRRYRDDFILEDDCTYNSGHYGELSPSLFDKSSNTNSRMMCRPLSSRRGGGGSSNSLFTKRKTLRVTSLREFNAVVPTFEEMHHHLKMHFVTGGTGVDSAMIFKNVKRDETATNNDAARRNRQLSSTTTEYNDDEATHVSNAGSIASFGSFMSSLRGIVDYVGSGRKSDVGNINNPPSSAKYYPKTRYSHNGNTIDNDSSSDEEGAAFDGRASPSSINGVLSGLVEKESFFSTTSSDKNTSVSTLFKRMQHKFSRDTTTTNNNSSSSKKNTITKTSKFITNYFYTASTKPINNNSHPLKLDIHNTNGSTNREEQKDGFCNIRESGCHNINFLGGCDTTMGNAMDVVYNWFTHEGSGHTASYNSGPYYDGYCDVTKRRNESSFGGGIQNNMILHHGWIKTWHLEGDGCDRRRFFVPPRLGIESFDR